MPQVNWGNLGSCKVEREGEMPSANKRQGETMQRPAKKRFLILALVLLVTAWACERASEERPDPPEKFPPALIAHLNSSTQPLSGADPELPDGELAPLADLGQARIVGLGEATHGTHEFFAMKHRLFRWLVERFDFRTFAFECDYGESIYLDRWLNHGEGDLDDLMRNTMHFWTWRTVEVKALFEWMRRVNLERPETERLHFVGVDCQYATYQPALLREYLERVSPQRRAGIEPLLAREESFRDSRFSNLSWEEYQSLQQDLEAEWRAWQDLKEEFTRQSSPREFETARQLLRSLSQVNQFVFERNATVNYRDLFMADNALWAQEHYGAGRGIAFWAHNLHVANDSSDNWADATGYHLRQQLGRQYVAVGFSFCRGTFSAWGYDPVSQTYTGLQVHTIDVPPLAYSVNDLFFVADKKAFFVRLDRLVPGEPLHVWFNQGRKMLNIGAAYDGDPHGHYLFPFSVPLHYDVLVHFDRSTFAAQI